MNPSHYIFVLGTGFDPAEVLKQLPNRLTKRQNRHRAALVIRECDALVVDAEVAIDGGPEVVGGEGAVVGLIR